MTRWLLVKGDEDGNPITWLDEGDLERLLGNPEEERGVTRFLAEVPEREDPNYWPEGVAMLLKAEVVVPKPVDVVKKWSVDR
jgi:hypothetical protein